jgi:heme/copper-type cytochrome/quinol oxidase subunit 3
MSKAEERYRRIELYAIVIAALILGIGFLVTQFMEGQG